MRLSDAHKNQALRATVYTKCHFNSKYHWRTQMLNLSNQNLVVYINIWLCTLEMNSGAENTSGRPVESLWAVDLSLSKMIRKNILLRNSFASIHIESIFGMRLPWDNRHQPHSSVLNSSLVAMSTRVKPQ